MANSQAMRRDVNRDHFCPKCGERMRKIRDNSGLVAKCPKLECGFDYHIFWRFKNAEQKPAKQLPLFPPNHDGIPF